jgi:hypothetical protein
MRSDVSSLRLCSALRQNFGLNKRVDCLSAERRSWPGCENEDRIRVTALWRRFISFAWETSLADVPVCVTGKRGAYLSAQS